MEEQIAVGEQLFAEGKLEDARRLFQQMLAADPTNKQALNNLGVIAFESAQLEIAVSYFLESLRLDPDYRESLQNITEITKGLTHEQLIASPPILFSHLYSRISTQTWSHDDSLLLGKGITAISAEQKLQLLKKMITSPQTNTADPVLFLLRGITSLTDTDLQTLGQWLERTPMVMTVRDRIRSRIPFLTTNIELIETIALRVGAADPNPRPVDIDLVVRKVVKLLATDDPFFKEVPPGAPKKDGLRILVISDFNIAGQLTRLFRTINKYTNHVARCVILQDDYLQYDKDVLVRDLNGVVSNTALDEARELIKRADFFHIGRGLVNLPGIDWGEYLCPTNCVFQYFGSELRNNGPAVEAFHKKTGFEGLTAVDWTMVKRLRVSFYDLQAYFLDVDEMPKTKMDFSGGIKICHAPSGANYRDIKRTDIIEEIILKVAKENPKVQPVMISGLKNDECLKRKSDCHLHFVSLWQSFGNNTTESAAMGLVPVVQLANFSRYIFPDTPVAHVTADTAYDTITALVKDEEELKRRGRACHEWAKRHFDSKTLIQKYWYLYDFIYHGLSVDYQEFFPGSWKGVK